MRRNQLPSRNFVFMFSRLQSSVMSGSIMLSRAMTRFNKTLVCGWLAMKARRKAENATFLTASPPASEIITWNEQPLSQLSTSGASNSFGIAVRDSRDRQDLCRCGSWQLSPMSWKKENSLFSADPLQMSSEYPGSSTSGSRSVARVVPFRATERKKNRHALKLSTYLTRRLLAEAMFSQDIDPSRRHNIAKERLKTLSTVRNLLLAAAGFAI